MNDLTFFALSGVGAIAFSWLLASNYRSGITGIDVMPDIKRTKSPIRYWSVMTLLGLLVLLMWATLTGLALEWIFGLKLEWSL